MKNYSLIYLLCISLLFISCSPKIRVSASKSLPSLDADIPIAILGVPVEVPADADIVGTIKIGDNGLSVNCSYDAVISLASEQARSMGGNIVKLTEHKLPSAMGSSCHRIKAIVLFADNVERYMEDQSPDIDSLLLDEGVAVVHFYRSGGPGALVGYDVRVDDEVICRISNNSKESVKVKALGNTKFWASTESRDEVQINLQPGRHYYVRCGVDMGIVVGRPSLTLVDNITGEMESENIAVKTKIK